MKKVIIPFLLLLLVTPATAQHLGNPDVPYTFSQMVSNMGDTVLYIILGIAVLMLFLVAAVYFSTARLLDKVKGEHDPIYAARAQQSFWARLFSVNPIEEDKDKVLDHNYDDIHELNNPIPAWFMWLFYITVVFGVVYLLHYHVFNSGKLQEEEYVAQMEQAEIEKQAYLKKVGDKINSETVTLLTAEADLAKGKELYMKTGSCVTCHKEDGGGSVGPNLTDEYWKHGGGIKNVFKTVIEGVPNTGMKSWKKDFSNQEIQQIASYVISLQGTNPPNAKEPEGEKWSEDGQNAPAQEVKTDSVELSMR
jgi:cytochrome c oxidase cbb3-type subunit 3